MTYEYSCSNCQHNWEECQPITADPITLCPKCAQNTAQKIISGGSYHLFKGKGLNKGYHSTFEKSDRNV